MQLHLNSQYNCTSTKCKLILLILRKALLSEKCFLNILSRKPAFQNFDDIIYLLVCKRAALFDKVKIEAPTQNIYKAIAVMSKRASQVNEDLKSELIDKLEEFATFNDSLEEVFENKEQIEVSRFYERLPKPTSIAVQEWLDDEIYYRTPDKDNDTIE